MSTRRSRPDNVSTRRSPPDNVLEDNTSTVPPYPSSFLIHHRDTLAHTGNISRDALPSSRADVFAAIVFILRIQSADATVFTGPFQLKKTFIGPVQPQGRGHTGAGERHYESTRNMQWQVP